MRRRGGEDLDVPAPRKIRERANQIASEADSVSLTEAAERGEIEVGERGAPRVALLHEAGRVPLRAANLVVDVLEVANVDVVIGKLLEEDRRQSDDDAVAHALRTEIVKQHEERQVRSEHRFVDPLLAVRPAAGASAVRQVRVQCEDERSHEGHSVTAFAASAGVRCHFVPQSLPDRASG